MGNYIKRIKYINKNMKYVICIPVYKLSQRVYDCIESIQDKNILIIDNTGKKECAVFKKYNVKVF